MPTLAEEAAAAAEAERQAREAALEQQRTERRAAARDAVKAMLVRADGTSMTLTEAGLSIAHSDPDRGVVVYSDGTIALGASEQDGAWRVHLVTGSGSDWTRASEPLTNLADLGAALGGA